ncbi:MAG: sialidase family protein [Clostridium sp.]|uniref:sialidase family protein n=1 Tax=Clostridium sp. TaxID=1506 RepID=UPI0029126F50|nr:sialidase family protein [Clostridium sp.]MDU7336851.1 sialidase family protein [Clostridium sp.]
MNTATAGFFRHIEKESILGEKPPFEACHSSTLAVLPNGDLFCVWFAGSHEGEDDVAIWGARRTGGKWLAPQVLQQNGLPHWNPVLFVKKDGSVLLFFKVGREIASWQTWVCESNDNCLTWSPARELVPGDVGGRGPVRNKLIVLSSGRWLAPASLENGVWRSFADYSDDNGITWAKSSEVFIPLEKAATKSETYQEIPVSVQSFGGRGAIQPTLWESQNGNVHMLMRTSEGYIARSDSLDSGKTWCEGYPTSLPNNNSGIDLVKADDGRLFLVYNPVGENWGPRFPLRLACSLDDGETWEDIYTLEETEGEYSYPSINCSGDTLYVTYTNCRKDISFWSFQLNKSE